MMGRVIINQNSGSSVTELSNIFIDEYLAEANDAQIKVYLYLLRMMCSGRSTSVSDLADMFNYTEKDVLRALRYWESKSLMTLEYDDAGALSGIHIEDIVPGGVSSRRTADTSSLTDEASVRPFPSGIAKSPAPAPHRDNPQMLFVAEQYFGRTLNPLEIKSLYFIQDDLGFSDDLTDYLLQYCASMGKKDFEYAKKVAMGWHDEGITTPEEARLTQSIHRNSYTIMKELGMQNAPTSTEQKFFERWQCEYGFSLSVITEACRRTVLQTQNKRIQYCDGILRKWHDAGAKTLADIKKLDEDYEKSAASSARTSKPGAVIDTRFNNFRQNSYNLDSMESQLLDN